jgi:Leucine-rich repeat (LRR) protein
MDENGLRSLANIEKLQNLNTLSLAANRIGEFHELEKLVELPML